MKYFIQFFKSSKCIHRWEGNAHNDLDALSRAFVEHIHLDGKWASRGVAYHVKIVTVP